MDDLVRAARIIDAARQTSATRSRFSTSARARTPLLDDSMPSKRATTDLPRTDDKPVSGSVGSFMAGVVSGKWRGSA